MTARIVFHDGIIQEGNIKVDRPMKQNNLVNFWNATPISKRNLIIKIYELKFLEF